jgi:hypothetical protein
MVQEARKLNALENNTWPSGVPTTGPIQLEGVAIGGDLTDCGAGADSPKSFHGNQCEDYDSPVNGQQLIPFLKVFDRYYGPRQSLKLDALYFLTGLTNPDGDTLRYPIFPGFGNHDLNFYDSGVMRSYIANWKPSNSNMPGISITNEDPGSESYSWDWGGLHLINAGVFVGSDDQDYNFSSDALTWIEKDLATYAADGRPVVIFQHFGLDNGKYNLWFTPSHRYFMMKAIKNYNVIGIFTGHQHEHLGSFNWPFQAWNTSWPPFPISIYPYPLSPFDSAYPYNYPLSVYDVFHPGAAFAQNLALVHVTNDRIDVTYADTTSDFDPSTGSVTFVEPFSKGLIPAPQAASPIHNAPGLFNSSTIVRSNRVNYLVTLGAGAYQVSRVNIDGSETVTSSGFSSSIDLPSEFWNSTIVPSPTGTVYVGNGPNVAALTIDSNGKLNTSWTMRLPINADSLMAFQYRNTPYLLVNQTSDATTIVYRVGREGEGVFVHNLTQVERLVMDKLSDLMLNGTRGPGYPQGSQFIPFQDPQNLPRFVRYDPAIGTAEFFTMVDSSGQINLAEVSTENTWAPHASAIQPFSLYDGSTAFFILSNPCFYGVLTVCSPESPYLIRKLKSDAQSTEISWRGNVSTPAISVISALYTSTPQQSVYLSATSSSGKSFLLGIHDTGAASSQGVTNSLSAPLTSGTIANAGLPQR